MSLQDSLRYCGGASGAYQEALGQVLTGIVSELEVLLEAVSKLAAEGVVEDGRLVERVESLEKRISESVLPLLDGRNEDLEKLRFDLGAVKIDLERNLEQAVAKVAVRVERLESGDVQKRR